MASTRTVARERAGTVRVAITCSPFSFENVSVTGAGSSCGLAISTSSSKKLPVAPSERK